MMGADMGSRDGRRSRIPWPAQAADPGRAGRPGAVRPGRQRPFRPAQAGSRAAALRAAADGLAVPCR